MRIMSGSMRRERPVDIREEKDPSVKPLKYLRHALRQFFVHMRTERFRSTSETVQADKGLLYIDTWKSIQ